MKIITVTAAIAAAITLTALPAAAQNTNPANAPTDQVTPEKGARPRSHVEWKMGAAPAAPATSVAKANPWTDYTKHFHPRDR